MAGGPLALPSDVADVWRPLTADEEVQVANLIAKASAKLRQAAPFDIDQRIAQFQAGSDAPTALDPMVVADVVATIVKRFMVNPDGAVSSSESVGPYSRANSYVFRYDKSGADTRGTITVTPADVDQLRPAMPTPKPGSFRVGIAPPRVELPGFEAGRRDPYGVNGGIGPVVAPDVRYTDGWDTDVLDEPAP